MTYELSVENGVMTTMQNDWYYELLGEEFGPVPFEHIEQLVDSGTLSPSDQVRSADGGPTRTIASIFDEDAAQSASASPELDSAGELNIDDFEFASETEFTPPTAVETQLESFYWQSNGQSRGPITREQLIQLADKGALDNEALVRADNEQEWKPASEMPELAAALLCVSGTLAPPKKQKPAKVASSSDSATAKSTSAAGKIKPSKSSKRTKAEKSDNIQARRKRQREQARDEHLKQAGLVESAFDNVFGDEPVEQSPAAASTISTSAPAETPNTQATDSQSAAGFSEAQSAARPTPPTPPQPSRPPYQPPVATRPKRSSRGGSPFGDLFSDREQVTKVLGIVAGLAAVYFAYTFLFSGIPDASDVETSLRSFIDQYDQLATVDKIPENEWRDFGNTVRDDIYPFLESYQSASGSKDDRDIQMYEAAVMMIDLVNCDPADKKRRDRISGEFRAVMAGNSDDG